MSDKLSDKQKSFLAELFGSCAGNSKAAAKKVIGTEDYSSLMTDDLVSEIRKRGDKEIAMNVPRAIHTISKLLEDPDSAAFAMPLHKIAADILDRAGISKQERTQQSQVAVGIVFLPAKQELPEPPSIIDGKSVEIPVLKKLPVEIK